MFNGDERFRMGRILTDGQFVENRFKRVFQSFQGYNKHKNHNCQACWAAPLCFGCIGGDLINTGQTGAHSMCEVTREIAETVLLEVAGA
jgi:radical SAM protein with 4Fe4S-binding SPASM domain